VFRAKISVLLVLVPLVAIGAGTAGLLDRVPTLPNSVAEAGAGRAKLEAQVSALEVDIEAANAELQSQQEEAFAANEKIAEQQSQNLQNLTGMSADEMDAAEEGEIEANMLGAMGMTMDDMEALEGMDDAEAEAYFASKQFNTEGLQQFADAAPKSSDPARLERLTREFGDWQSGYSTRALKASEEFTALSARWAQDHAQLDARLNSEMASRTANVPIVDCGEAGDNPDAIALHAIALDRAKAHAELAPGQLKQGIDFLSGNRKTVKSDAMFADGFATDAAGLDEMAPQSISVQQIALRSISELLLHTQEINKEVLSWVDRKTELEGTRPKSSCG